MIIGIMTVNDFEFHPNMRFKEAAKALGHQVQLINPYDLGCLIKKGESSMLYDQAHPLPDLIMPRQGSPMGEYGFVLMGQFATMGIPMVNSPGGVKIARNQYLTIQALVREGLPVPDTAFVTRESVFFDAVDCLGGYPVIAKQVDGMGGTGVAKILDSESAKAFLSDHLNPVKGLLVQKFILPKGRQDLRLLVLGHQVIGAMALTPSPGNFKANIHQDGQAKAFAPTAALEELAVAASRACGLQIAGVDMIIEKGGKPMVLEVNYSPGFKGLEQATGMNVAGDILDHVTSVAGEKFARSPISETTLP